jgi:uncharacterized protein (DUF2147 family)
MKKIITIVLVALSLPVALFAQSLPDRIIGKWKNPTGEKTMEIYKKNELFYGKIVEDADRELPLGLMILKDFKFVPDDNRWEGTVFVPKQTKDFTGKLSLKDKNTLVITVTSGFFSRSKEWSKVK